MNSQKHHFDLDPKVHYLNCAYMSPLSQAVTAAGQAALLRKVQPYQITPEDFFTEVDQLKSLFAHLVNAEDANRIAIIPSVSYGIAIVAKNLKTKPGQHIIVADAQFPSNVYAWRELAKARQLHVNTVAYPVEIAENRGETWNHRILESINKDTVLVSIEHVHWANGTKFDLENIGKRCREVGALFVIDGTQSVGALPFDVQKFGVDALICGGYKTLMGPYGLGYAYFGRFFDDGKPLEETWTGRLHSENFASLVNYQDQYQPLSAKYDMGEKSSFIHVAMGIVALTEVIARDAANIQDYSRQLTTEAVGVWQDAGYWVEDKGYRSQHLFGIQLPKAVSSASLLAALRLHQIFVSVRGDFVRISTNVYNDTSDIDALTEVLLQDR